MSDSQPRGFRCTKTRQTRQELAAPVISPIADREYGILDPDGFGLRFGTWLTAPGAT